MVSVLHMLHRFVGAIKHAAKEETFAAVVGAAIVLVLAGTITYSLGEGWNVADGFYFAVCTLTTSSIADPNLTLTHEALKIFTALYVLTGIGILVAFRAEEEPADDGARDSSGAGASDQVVESAGSLGRVRYHLFVCHGSSLSEAAPPLDQLARWSALKHLLYDRGGGHETLLIKMRPARVEKVLPRLLDPSG